MPNMSASPDVAGPMPGPCALQLLPADNSTCAAAELHVQQPEVEPSQEPLVRQHGLEAAYRRRFDAHPSPVCILCPLVVLSEQGELIGRSVFGGDRSILVVKKKGVGALLIFLILKNDVRSETFDNTRFILIVQREVIFPMRKPLLTPKPEFHSAGRPRRLVLLEAWPVGQRRIEEPRVVGKNVHQHREHHVQRVPQRNHPTLFQRIAQRGADVEERVVGALAACDAVVEARQQRVAGPHLRHAIDRHHAVVAPRVALVDARALRPRHFLRRRGERAQGRRGPSRTRGVALAEQRRGT